MNRPRLLPFLGKAAIVLALGGPGLASAQCPPGTVQSPFDVIQERLDPRAVAINKEAEQPRKAPESKQVSAPASSGASTSLVNGASFPELLGLAFDQGLVSSANGATTVDLNLFGFKALVRPEILDLQSEYQKDQFLRRWGGTLALGGKGESFDRDGDGTADPALDATSLGDNVVWEVRYRFAGSRDRRDDMNVAKLFQKAGEPFINFVTLSNDFMNAHSSEFNAMIEGGCFNRKKVEQFLNRPEIAADIEKLAESNLQTTDVYDTVSQEIDNSPIWTLVAGGTRRKEELGPDKRMAALRGSLRNFTLNLEWSRINGFRGTRDQTLWKGGFEYSRLFLQGSGFTPALNKSGVELSLSGAYEKYQDVPTAGHDTIGKLNVKLEIPVMEGVKLPLSITWANHKDLLDARNEIQGHFGFAVDLTQLRKLGRDVLKKDA
jgi:hypothetical protein